LTWKTKWSFYVDQSVSEMYLDREVAESGEP